MKRKIGRFFIYFIAAVLLCTLFPVTGLAARSGDFEYEVNGGKVTITGYTGSSTSVTIPSTIGGLPVTGIGASAFEDSSIKNLTLNNGLIDIGKKAFYGSDLTGINLPGSLKTIGINAFSYCYKLANINVDPSNTVYSSRDGVLFDKGVTSIYLYPIGHTRTTYTIPGTVTEIGSLVFMGCSLTEIIIPGSVTTFANFAFDGCEYLKNITIPGSVGVIPSDSFLHCYRLENINVDPSNSVYSSVNGVLFDKEVKALLIYPMGSKRISYTIPDSVVGISNEAFSIEAPFGSSPALKSVTIPGSVGAIGYENFGESLKRAVFKGDAPTIAYGVFDDAAPDFKILYPKGRSGWKTPSWNDYPAYPYDFLVTYDSEGGSFIPCEPADSGSAISAPVNPVRTGYTFGGWRDGSGELWDFTNDKVASDVALHANWIPNTYTVSFKANGGTGTMGPESFTYGETKALAANAFTRMGYTFAGWATSETGDVAYRNQASVSNLTAVNGGSITLYAKWTSIANTCIVTFNSQGGSTVASVAIPKYSKIAKPANPTRAGYTFGGWYKEAKCKHAWNFSIYKVNGNTTLYAKWTIIKYTVQFDSEGGSHVSSKKANYNTTISQPKKPKKTGYTFVAWYKEAGLKNLWNFTADKVTANITLFAKWNINSYSVSFNSKGGSSVSGIKADYNSLITAPKPPVKTGYTFAGWYRESKCKHAWYFSINRVKGNTTLYAKWTINKYTVHFDSQGGSAVPDKIVNYNTKIVVPKAPVLAGYTFAGWYVEKGCLTKWNFAKDTVTSNTTLYAKWIK